MAEIHEYVPKTFRQAGPHDPEVIKDVALMNLVASGADLDTQVGFLSGMQKHLEFVNDKDQDMGTNKSGSGWRWYSETIKEVRIIDRISKENNFLLGRKAEIVFESDETIMTNWIEFNSYESDLTIFWDLALAKSIAKDAQEGIGLKASILKKVWNDGSGPKGGRRECIGINVYHNSKNQEESKPSKKKPKSESSIPDSDEELTLKNARGIAKSLRIDYADFEDDLKELIEEINSGEIKKEEHVYDFVADVADVEFDAVEENADLDIFDKYEDNGLGWQLLALGIDLLDRMIED